MGRHHRRDDRGRADPLLDPHLEEPAPLNRGEIQPGTVATCLEVASQALREVETVGATVADEDLLAGLGLRRGPVHGTVHGADPEGAHCRQRLLALRAGHGARIDEDRGVRLGVAPICGAPNESQSRATRDRKGMAPWVGIPRLATLAPGSRLGAYDVVSSLGAGGAWAGVPATDTKLGREVAVEHLSPALRLRSRAARPLRGGWATPLGPTAVHCRSSSRARRSRTCSPRWCGRWSTGAPSASRWAAPFLRRSRRNRRRWTGRARGHPDHPVGQRHGCCRSGTPDRARTYNLRPRVRW